MFHFRTETATIVAIQKNRPLSNSRQMYITCQIEKSHRTFSFYWTSSPAILIDSKLYSSKAPFFFEEFWNEEELIGKKVMLHHAADDTYAYLTPT